MGCGRTVCRREGGCVQSPVWCWWWWCVCVHARVVCVCVCVCTRTCGVCVWGCAMHTWHSHHIRSPPPPPLAHIHTHTCVNNASGPAADIPTPSPLVRCVLSTSKQCFEGAYDVVLLLWKATHTETQTQTHIMLNAATVLMYCSPHSSARSLCVASALQQPGWCAASSTVPCCPQSPCGTQRRANLAHQQRWQQQQWIRQPAAEPCNGSITGPDGAACSPAAAAATGSSRRAVHGSWSCTAGVGAIRTEAAG